MTRLSWYIDMQYLTDNAPLLSSLPDTYTQGLPGWFLLYHTLRFSVVSFYILVLEL
jgi:hypothetical protein